jgi:hypothetical protein
VVEMEGRQRGRPDRCIAYEMVITTPAGEGPESVTGCVVVSVGNPGAVIVAVRLRLPATPCIVAVHPNPATARDTSAPPSSAAHVGGVLYPGGSPA